MTVCESARRGLVTVASGERGESEPSLAENKIPSPSLQSKSGINDCKLYCQARDVS